MKLLLLGDSLFARKEGQQIPHIEFSLLEQLPQLSINNQAISGANTYDVKELLERKDVSGADLVFLLIGTNDMATHKQVYLGEFQENLLEILSRLSQLYAPNQLIVLGITPVDEQKQRYRSNRLAGFYNEIIEKVAHEKGAVYLSLMDSFLEHPLPLNQLLKGSMDDGLHFGSHGYTLLAEKMMEKIRFT